MKSTTNLLPADARSLEVALPLQSSPSEWSGDTATGCVRAFMLAKPAALWILFRAQPDADPPAGRLAAGHSCHSEDRRLKLKS